MEIEANNTVWLGSRFTEHTVAIHFLPARVFGGRAAAAVVSPKQ